MANRALLVGINQYPRQPLRGCINDVQDVRAVLIEKCGFAAADVRLLTEKDATTAGIRDALVEWLLKGAVPGDRLLYHFSGHGSRLLSPENEVHDVICPVDFDFTPSRALSDADFRTIFAAIPAGAHFNWISDSCHSGDLARSFGMRDVLPRFLPPPPALAAAIEKALAKRPATRSLTRAVEQLNGVLIAGCQSDEESADAKIDGRYSGALTYFLVKELRSATGLTRDIEGVLRSASDALLADRYHQHPQIRGQATLIKRPFMAAALASSPPSATALAPILAPNSAPSSALSSAAGPLGAAAVLPSLAAVASALAAAAPAGGAIAAIADPAGASSMSAQEVAEARGWRERDDATTRGATDKAPATMSKAELAAIPKEKIAALISDETHALVLAAEIGSKSEYDRKYKHPEWPGGDSGVTIGFGSDLGYFDENGMSAAWSGLVADTDYKRLDRCVGLKGAPAKGALANVTDIVVPWDLAEKSYRRHTVEEYGREVIGAFPNAMLLHPHSFGALYSLVYNRGSGMSGDKRQEMRNIRDHMAARRFGKVPDEFRAMKKLWVGKFAGLVKRREDEAKLFEKGLLAASVMPPVVVKPVVAVDAAPAVASPPPQQQMPSAATAPLTPPTASIAVASPVSATPPLAGQPTVPTPISAPSGPTPLQQSAPASGGGAGAAAAAAIGNASPAVAAVIAAMAEAKPVAATVAGALGAAPPPAAVSPSNATDEPIVADTRSAHHPDGDGQLWNDDFEQPADPRSISRSDEWAAVHWAKSDEDSTEYRHLTVGGLNEKLRGATFDLAADDLELLISANAFEPARTGGRIIFALRGAELVVGPGANEQDKFRQVDRATIKLKDNRPDHRHFRCVIGVYDIPTRKLSAFIASTVPCRQAIIGYINGGEGSNMLPAGCYQYVCGPHKDRQGCLREDEDFTVLRTKRNTLYDTKDTWDLTFPADNLHPAFSNASAEFSSWGCQTVRGNHNKADGSFSGEYNEFRNALGLKPKSGSHGLKFHYVMLTGLEAAIASDLRRRKSPPDATTAMLAISRLRHGSRGDRVRALQAALGVPVDGAFNGTVKKALIERQQSKLGWADGVYAPDMDQLLGLDIFKPAPVAVTAPVASQPVTPAQPTQAPVVVAAPPIAVVAPPQQSAPQSPLPIQPTAQVQPSPQLPPVAQMAAPQPIAVASAPGPAAADSTRPTPNASQEASAAVQAALAQMSGGAAGSTALPLSQITASSGAAVTSAATGEPTRGQRAVARPEPAPQRRRRGKLDRVALVIGNGDYAYPHALANPVNDAALITRKLARAGFAIIGGAADGKVDPKVDLGACNGRNLNRADMWARVKEFLSAIETGTEAVIYYAGHGIQLYDQNYLVPIDATIDADDPVPSLVPLNSVVDRAVERAGGAGRVIVFLDACRVNPFSDRQLQTWSDSMAGRALTRDGDWVAAPPTVAVVDPGSVPVRARGLAPLANSKGGASARTFISYATSPGAVAFDGRGNSPFAAALGRNLDTRNLQLEDLACRVGLDVQEQIAANNDVQDPWYTTNLKVPYFFKPRSWWPVVAMGAMGVIAGAITCFLLFPRGELVNPFFQLWAWTIGLIFGAVAGIGTVLWGSATGEHRWFSARDVTIAVLGTALAFALALVVLQLINDAGGRAANAATSTALTPKIISEHARTAALAFRRLAIVCGVAMFVATLLCWPRNRWNWAGIEHHWLGLVLPILLTLSLLALEQRLFEPTQIGVILVALIACVLFTTGSALALRPQQSVFHGFGSLTGAITVGLTAAIFFDVFFRIKEAGVSRASLDWIAVGMGAAWFGLLGAQIGYCFSYYVPERRSFDKHQR